MISLRLVVMGLCGLILVLISFAPADPAYAQTQDENEEEIPKEYLEEMQEVYEQCESTMKLSQFYDCKCRALAFLDQRIELGPYAPDSYVQAQVKPGCADPVKVAGRYFNICLNMIIPRGYLKPGQVCECFANEMARKFDRTPVIGSRRLVAMQADAYTKCGLGNSPRESRNILEEEENRKAEKRREETPFSPEFPELRE